MIQRKQTLYLLLITLIAGLMLWMDQAYFTASGNVSHEGQTFTETVEVGFYSTRTTENFVGNNIKLVYLEAIVGLMALVAIFFYRNRSLQLRLCVINYIVMIGVFIMMYDYSFDMAYMDSPSDQRLEPAALIPLSWLVLNFFTIRRIRADEQLVKSLDRIR